MEEKIFGIRARVCKSFFSKLKGLMFTRRKNAKPLFFVFSREKKIAIHMFFVFFPIKVIWLNKNKKVVEKKILKPFQSCCGKKKARYVLEIPL